ncbi:MAG: ferrochelatase, partial [Thermoanaerobaculia bacterium]
MAPPVGILIAQLGTPDAPTAPALRRYLRQFLGDPRVLEMTPLGRWLLLNLIVLPRRPRRSAALYRKVWTRDGSPLLLHTRAQAEGLAGALSAGARVGFGMRYGSPSMADA